MERLKTGVSGLDTMLKGGLPARRHVVLCGGPGCGKTTLSMQYLYQGAKEGEVGAYISLEEPAEKIVENIKASYSGWDEFDKLVKDKKLNIVKLHPMATKDPEDGFGNFVDVVQSFITQHKAKRVVVDSTNILAMIFEDPASYRRNLFNLLQVLNNLDATVILTMELSEATREEQKYGLEQFIADGVIVLYNLPMKEKRINAVEVLKMRGTAHSKNVCPLAFTPEGVVVYPDQKIY